MSETGATRAGRDSPIDLLVRGVVDYGIATLDLDGNVTAWNPGAERCFGRRREEVIGRPLALVYPPEEVAEGKPEQELAIAIAEGQWSREGWLVRSDGSEFWATLVLAALRADDGSLRGWGAIVHDDTERKHGEDLLRVDEERYRLVVEAVMDYGIFMLDPEGRIVSWNAGAERLKGYRAEEVIGKHFSVFYTESDVRDGKPAAELETAAATGRVEDEGWRVRKDGSRFWASVFITALRGTGGELRGFTKVTQDMTLRRQTELALQGLLDRERAATSRLRELDRLKDEFVAIVAHDLTAPLAVISGFVELLTGGWSSTTEQQKLDFLRRIGNQARGLAELVGDLLDVARISAGELQLDIGSVDAGDLVERAVAGYTSLADAERVRTSVPGQPLYCRGDERRTTQVVANLVANALKFSPSEAGVDVEVSGSKSEVMVSVRDRGRGIAAEDVPKLFQRFSRVAPEGRQNVDGTGLGLYIARSIIEAQGGRIWVDSTLGQGSTFAFSLPRDTTPATRPR